METEYQDGLLNFFEDKLNLRGLPVYKFIIKNPPTNKSKPLITAINLFYYKIKYITRVKFLIHDHPIIDCFKKLCIMAEIEIVDNDVPVGEYGLIITDSNHIKFNDIRTLFDDIENKINIIYINNNIIFPPTSTPSKYYTISFDNDKWINEKTSTVLNFPIETDEKKIIENLKKKKKVINT